MIVEAPLYLALALPLLLYLPGWALHTRLGAPADLLARHYERVVIGALWNGWLALLLAELGHFSLGLHLLATLVVCGLVALWGWNFKRPSLAQPTRNASRATLITAGAYVVILLVALLLVARPFETVLGVRDAGVYANTGFALARTGSLVQSDPLLAAWGQEAESDDPALAGPARQALSNYTISQPRDRYIATRLRAAGFFVNEGELSAGRVVPQGLHLLPAWIGLLTALGGPYLGLFAPGLLAVLGVWSVGMLGRRLAGPWVGGLAMLFLALNGTQIWFGRYSTAETLAQCLIFAGLYFFTQMQVAESNGDQHGASVAAALSGLAIGQVALARLDFFLLGPVLGYLLYSWLTRRWAKPHTALGLGLAVMLLHAALHISLIARAYFFDTGHDRLYRDYALLALLTLPFLTPAVRETFLSSAKSALVRPIRLSSNLTLGVWARVVAEAGVVVVAVAALFTLRARPTPLFWLERQVQARRGPLLNLVSVALLLLGSYAYLIRPAIINADILFNSRSGWGDPLSRDPALVALDVREGRMSLDEAQTLAGVALNPGPLWQVTPDLAATSVLRERLRAERGPWTGPFSNQTVNWLRVQGYVGAPIRLPVRLWYDEFNQMNWFEQLTVNPASLSSTPAVINDKYTIPLANLVRVGWYLSPLGVVLGIIGYALWWRHGLSRASWLFLAVAFVGTYFYVRQTYGTSDQHYIYILRRFVPITYPAFSLGSAYALVALAQRGRHNLRHGAARVVAFTQLGAAALACALQCAFLISTNQPLIRHTEYAGAVAQLTQAAAHFVPGRDVLLMRGGAPIQAESRDVPDIVATPLHFAFGLDAFAVKSSQPGKYAADLATVARRLREQGHEVYLLLSASGGNLRLPGFTLVPTGRFALDLPEFEQLTDQKPRNVSQLSLPFAIYQLVPAVNDILSSTASRIAPDDFAAQVVGLYRPEQRADGTLYAWTNGDATLRLPWSLGVSRTELRLTLAGGRRPPHLGAAKVCVSALPELSLWPNSVGTPVDLGCLTLSEDPAEYRLALDPARLPPAPGGTLLLRLDSQPWVPAIEDRRQSDRRTIGVQLGPVELRPPE